MRKIVYFLGLFLIAVGLVLAIPAFLQWIDFIFSFGFAMSSQHNFEQMEIDSILRLIQYKLIQAKSSFIQFAIGGFLIKGGQWLFSTTNDNKPLTRNINLNNGDYIEHIRDYVRGNKYED